MNTFKAQRAKTELDMIQCDYLSSHIVGGPSTGLAKLMARREQLISFKQTSSLRSASKSQHPWQERRP
jgi:hypothetical protein